MAAIERACIELASSVPHGVIVVTGSLHGVGQAQDILLGTEASPSE